MIEFSSFFAAALVASQDGYLVSKFAKSEADRVKEFFLKEDSGAKAAILAECFAAPVALSEEVSRGNKYSMSFEAYLATVARYALAKQPRWKLVRQALHGGTVFMSDNLLNDFFGDCAQQAVAEGAGKLRRAVFPKRLADLRNSVMRYVPVQKSQQRRGYSYVDGLLEHPVSDGRHSVGLACPVTVPCEREEDGGSRGDRKDQGFRLRCGRDRRREAIRRKQRQEGPPKRPPPPLLPP